MKSCKILRYGAVCGLAALAAVGCSVDDAETIRVRELTAAEHELFVPASGGTAQIQLYSNGRVRVEALNDIGGWASVDRSEFDGDGWFPVTFTENDSFRRMAKLRFVLDGGTRADTVCIKQYGVVPSLECPAPYKAIRGSVETFTQFEIDTNIPLGDFAVATAYVGPTRDWIRSVQPEQGMLVVDTKPNPGDDVCKAVVNLSYVDGWEETFSANLYITQADKDDEFGREVSFADVRALATAEGTAVDEDILIEGIVVSDFHSKNMEANPSVSYDKVDVTVNDCTAYLESPDGRYGFRLRFDTPEDNVLARGTRLSLSLSGTVLTREENPERYTISSLVGENMVESAAGEAIPVKQRRISELTDDDVYTFVSLENTEFLFKEGSYANVYENYSLSSDVNASQTGNNNRMDGWASLLMDDAGNSIYAPVNMLCLWRRSGQGVPRGRARPTASWCTTNCRATATWGATRSACSTSRASAWNGPGSRPIRSLPNGTATLTNTRSGPMPSSTAGMPITGWSRSRRRTTSRRARPCRMPNCSAKTTSKPLLPKPGPLQERAITTIRRSARSERRSPAKPISSRPA